MQVFIRFDLQLTVNEILGLGRLFANMLFKLFFIFLNVAL